MEEYKLDSRRYGTIGFRDTIPEQVQLLIWKMLESKLAEYSVLDYLQIFRLSKGQLGLQMIEHEQEEIHPFCYCESFTVTRAVECKVFVMDSAEEGVVIAMLGEEY